MIENLFIKLQAIKVYINWLSIYIYIYIKKYFPKIDLFDN